MSSVVDTSKFRNEKKKKIEKKPNDETRVKLITRMYISTPSSKSKRKKEKRKKKDEKEC